MDNDFYNKFKQFCLPYLPLIKGQFALHIVTNSIILVSRKHTFLNMKLYDCDVFIDGDFSGVSYDIDEIEILPYTLEDFTAKHNSIIGVQLQLF